MGATFNDITLYSPTIHSIGSSEYYEEINLKNYVSDLYVQKMHGYKPPKATRVTIQPYYYNIWGETWKNGSIISIAPYFEQGKYELLDKRGKQQYVLDIIHSSMLQLSEEYKWDKDVFERAYKEIIDAEFSFVVHYPFKISKDKKKKAKILIEKTETTTTVYTSIDTGGEIIKAILFSKINWHSFDEVYGIVRHNKWIDNDRYGIYINPLNFAVWYSLPEKKVLFEVKGDVLEEYNLKRMFSQF